MVEQTGTSVPNPEEVVTIGSMRVERWLLDKIDDLAAAERRNRNQQIHKMLEEWDAVIGPEVRQKHARLRAAREGTPGVEDDTP